MYLKSIHSKNEQTGGKVFTIITACAILSAL